jgi:hypothetical protein
VKKIAIVQSNYIPWKGFFDIVNDVDAFVFLDSVQMTKRDWRTRNKVKTPNGTEWLTVPFSGGRNQLIYEVEIVQNDWQKKHLKSLQNNYFRATYFKEYQFLLDWLYSTPHKNLSEFNIQTTKMICEILGIDTIFYTSMEIGAEGTKDERIINICKALDADTYLTGPTARDYIDERNFEEADITLLFKDYSNYPAYTQLFPPFDHAVSILDVLFNCGAEAPYYIWGWRKDKLVAELEEVMYVEK